MNINKRNAELHIAGGGIVQLVIHINGYKPLVTIDTTFLTSKQVTSTPNKELTTPSVVTLVDTAVPTRFTLISTNSIAHTGLDFKVYYDSKYSDIIVVPDLEQYANITYMAGTKLDISGHGINFAGKEGASIPTPNTGYAVSAALIVTGDRLSNTAKGKSFRKEIVVGYTTTEPAVTPKLIINFGTPVQMFTTLGFVADVHVLGFNSLTESTVQSLGKQALVNTGTLIAELSL